MAEIEIKNLVKSYGDRPVVHSINFTIHPSEFVVLVGPSGCGKSTTLRMIAGLEDISGGEIRIKGKVVNNLAPKDRNIAMVFQNYALYPHMSVRENLSFALKLQGQSPQHIETRVKEAAIILGIEDMLDRRPGQLSGGQRQRVAMGRALVRQPDVFLFDEPLSNLDAKLRTQMRVEIRKLHLRLKTTTVYVTHDQVEAMTLADRIVVMKDGTIQQIGTPMEIYENPTNTFVAGFMGTPPMNLVNGKDEVIGIRPEDFKMVRESQDSQEFSANVDLIEPLGGESLVHITLNQQKGVFRCDGYPKIKIGENIKLFVQKQKIKTFRADSGIRIS